MISCVLRDLTQLAAVRWRGPLSERAVARMCGLPVGTVNSLARDMTDRYDMLTLGVLCNLFGCDVGELLRDCGAPPLPTSIRRAHRPDDGHVLLPLPIQTTIPDRVRQCPPARFGEATGLARSTVDRLAVGDFQRIDRWTLDTLCSYWAVDVGALLMVDVPRTGPVLVAIAS